MNQVSTQSASNVARVCFTHALPGGLWLEFANGEREWLASAEIVSRFGEDTFRRFRERATADWLMVGCFRDV